MLNILLLSILANNLLFICHVELEHNKFNVSHPNFMRHEELKHNKNSLNPKDYTVTDSITGIYNSIYLLIIIEGLTTP